MHRIIILSMAGLTLLASQTQADTIQLSGGDTIKAKIIEVTADSLKIRHDVFGEVEIPRSRVRAMVFDPVASPEDQDQMKGISKRTGSKSRKKKTGDSEKQETPKEIIDRLVNPDFDRGAVEEMAEGEKRHQTPEDAVEELRRLGVSEAMKKNLQLSLPGFTTPEVQGYFNDRVQGLMNGSIQIGDIRNDAIDAREQLKGIMGELGPDAAALQGYFSILDHFIKETAPKRK